MYSIDPKVKDRIDKIIKDGGEVVFTAYSFLEPIESVLRYILDTIFNKNGKGDLLDPILSSIKELTTNAIKANIKTLLIKEGVIKNPSDPMSVLKGIKSVLNEKSLLEYGLKCRENGLSMRLHLTISRDSLIIRVIDPHSLASEVNDRMQNKITRAKNYENLAMCYLENPDPLAEGMGLGLSMIVVLLKGSGIDPDNFYITSDLNANKTTASIKVPLNS
jgi:hypothetical protein